MGVKKERNISIISLSAKGQDGEAAELLEGKQRVVKLEEGPRRNMALPG